MSQLKEILNNNWEKATDLQKVQIHDLSREDLTPARREKICLQRSLNHKSCPWKLKPRFHVERGAAFLVVVDGLHL